MAEKQVDARGLSCPEPVLLSKRAIGAIEAGSVEVLVDTVTAKENVTRMARSQGCSVRAEQQGEDFLLTLVKGAGGQPVAEPNATN